MIDISVKEQLYIGFTFYVVLLVCYLLYSQGLSGPFFFDDYPNLEALKNLHSGTSWGSIVFENQSGIFGRSVSMLTFVFDFLRGGGGAVAFKTTNLAIHLTTGCLIFWLAIELLECTELTRKRLQIALFLVSMWLLSPLFTSTVLYVIQRMAQLSSLFMFLAMLCYVKGRKMMLFEKSSFKGYFLMIICPIIIFPLAVFSKENGILLPIVLLLVESIFFQFAGYISEKKNKIRFQYLVLLLGLSLAVVLFPRYESLFDGYTQRNFTALQRLMTESRVLFQYIYALIVPSGAQFGVTHDDYPISINLFSPLSTLFSLLAWSGLTFLSLKFMWHQKYKVGSFGILFYLIAHSIESTIFPLEIYFEHRNYFPSFGILFGFCYFSFVLISEYKVVCLLFFLPAVFVAKTNIEVYYWTTQENLIERSYRAHPDSNRSRIMMASLLTNQKKYEDARDILNLLRQDSEFHIGASIQLLVLDCLESKPLVNAEIEALHKTINKRLRIDQPVYESENITYLFNHIDYCPEWRDKKLASFINDLAKNINTYAYGTSKKSSIINGAELLDKMGFDNYPGQLTENLITSDPDNLDYSFLYLKYLMKAGDVEKARNHFSKMDAQAIQSSLHKSLYNTYLRIFSAI